MHSLFLLYPKMGQKIIEVVETTKDLEVFYHNIFLFFIIIVISVLFDRAFSVIKRYCSSKLYVIKAKEYREEYMKMDYQQVIDLGTGKGISRIEK